jgi:hypothetical protein
MAQIKIEDNTVVICLSRAEKFGALHGDLHFPRSAVMGARIVEKPFAEIQGFRSPGTRVPGIMALGTWRRRGGGRDFVAVYRGERGIVVEVDPNAASFQRVILSSKDPDGVRTLLTAAA